VAAVAARPASPSPAAESTDWRVLARRLLTEIPRDALIALPCCPMLVGDVHDRIARRVVLSLSSLILAFAAFFYRELRARGAILIVLACVAGLAWDCCSHGFGDRDPI